jgi:hypothetical protein
MAKKLQETSAGGLAKYSSSVKAIIEESMKKRTQVKSGSKSYTVDNTPQNIKTLAEFVKLAGVKFTEAQAYELTLTASGTSFPIGMLDKPNDKGNKGDIAEGILGAAIAARFIHKNTEINIAKVKDVLRSLGPLSGKVKEKDFESLNKNPKVKDNVHLYIRLAEPNMKVLLDSTKWTDLTDIFNSAVKYANGETVIAWSKLLYENNQQNTIDVISDGLSEQTGTKVDVKVKVDDQETNIKVSLKAGDVKQFGQVGGTDFDKQVYLWKKLLDIDVSSKEDVYLKHLAAKNVSGALYTTYSYAAEQINIKLGGSSSKVKLLKDLGNGITFFATLHEEDVTLVQLSRNEAVIYRFDKVYDSIKHINLKAVIKDSAGKPKLILEDDKQKSLLEVRVKSEEKKEGFYIRNYIEKGKILAGYLAKSA